MSIKLDAEILFRTVPCGDGPKPPCVGNDVGHNGSHQLENDSLHTSHVLWTQQISVRLQLLDVRFPVQVLLQLLQL
eukprot:241447-Amphidinium_carterae.1